jgi:2-polyprenyl-6-methoxyphenol hydroxylase-like FAD-dependent oxidoreductase
VGVVASSATQTYVYLIHPEKDVEGRRIPVDAESWTRDFPVLEPLMKELAQLPAIQHNYIVAKCSAWSRGRLAVLGDAAHALPPLLGQGAGLALSESWVLSQMLRTASRDDVPGVLQRWEQTYRRFADWTQNWSIWLDTMTNKWPKPLMALRPKALSTLSGYDLVRQQMRAADNYPLTP